MAKRHHSAVRQQRRSVRRNKINKQNKSTLRTEVKRVRELMEKKDKDSAQKALTKACSTIDRTVKKGTIHANTGARYKSRLTRQVAALNSPPAK